MKKIPVILDVDTGIDDALGILLAAYSEQLDILAIMAVNGNASLKDTYHNTCAIASHLKLNIPIGKGCIEALNKSSVHAYDAHGNHGLGDIDVPYNSHDKVLDAIELYIDLLSQSDVPITIIATGPLTNLATLIINHPEIKPKIKQICFMGGSLSQGNITRYAEFNVYCDPEACQIVLQSHIPLVMVPLDVTRVTTYSASDLALIQKGLNPAQGLYTHLLEYYLLSFQKRTGLKDAPLHDSSAVAYICHPEWFSSKPYALSVDTSQNKTRAKINILLDTASNIEVITSTNREAIVQMTIDSINWIK
jgi:pyrimidine-specific ribonucleoside hydrolase